MPMLALVFSLTAVAGSLYLSLGLGLLACPLCFYQRTFAFGLVAVLSVGLLVPDGRAKWLCTLALPLAVGGFGVAGFHTYLVLTGKLECPPGIGGIRSAPEQSLAAYTPILLSLLAGAVGEWRRDRRLIPAGVVGFGLGLAAVYGSISANPPGKKAEQPLTDAATLKTCQVPYSSTPTQP